MTLEKACEIQKLCNKIDKIEETIKYIQDCCYINVNIVKDFYTENSENVKVLKGSKVYNHIVQGYKEERDKLIRKLNDM